MLTRRPSFWDLLALLSSFRQTNGNGLLSARDFAASPPFASFERSTFSPVHGALNVFGCTARILWSHKTLRSRVERVGIAPKHSQICPKAAPLLAVRKIEAHVDCSYCCMIVFINVTTMYMFQRTRRAQERMVAASGRLGQRYLLAARIS
jgi:hypothetical protein